MDINEIFETVRNDASLIANIDIEQLLKAVNSESTNYLDDKTLDDIIEENIRVIQGIIIDKKTSGAICDKLAGYRYIDNLSELHKGKHIRWIRLSDRTLTNGAIVFDIKFYDTGSQILCKNIRNRMMQIKFDDCLIFQKLSMGEQLILMAYEHVKKTEVSSA